MSEAPMPVEVFCSYAHEDEAWLRKLERHLSPLERQGLVALWYDRLIVPGTNWAKTIDTHLDTASVILLLVSADFFASGYCVGIEMQRALQRQEAGEACVIPILIRAVDWTGAPFAHLQALPTDAKPLATWQDEDTALADVAAGIRRTIEELPLLAASTPRAALPSIWNIPYPRNPYFTGRDDLLDRLHQELAPASQIDPTTTRRAALTQPQAIKGLGGIGKTQIAVEYAYRSRELDRYTYTFWINAASEEGLITSFAALAELLPAFSAKGEMDQRKLVEAIKRWLEQCKQRWLLIFDNADDVALVRDYLPQQGNGSVLLTTRADAVGSLAASVEVETMGFIEGTHLLLRRAQRFEQASDERINRAGDIVVALDHFPLALDQAGAYIDETKCSFIDYLHIYQNHRKALLARRGTPATNYPDSVATTWSLSFQKVEQTNPAAAELLRLCAFLAPDQIPEELLKDGAAHWPPLLHQAVADLFAFDQMIEELLKFSLVKRLADDHMLSIHRLVQAVQMDMMEPEMQRQWAESVVRAVNQVFPGDPQDIATWPQCLRYLDQVQACNVLIEQYMLPFIEAADLFNRTGIYLNDHALYAVAEPLLKRALAIREQQLGAMHPDTATSLNNLAKLYQDQGKYEQAEPLFQRSLRIREQTLGSAHPEVAHALNNLAEFYREQGKYEQAEPLFQRSLQIREQALGSAHPEVAYALNNLADFFYREQGKYEQAEPLFQRSLRIREQALGPAHPEVAHALSNLAKLYYKQGKYEQAEPLYLHSLRIREQVLGLAHPEVARVLNNLADLYREQGKYEQAEPLYLHALRIREQQLGPEHLLVAYPLNGLANLYKKQGKYAEAEPLYLHALRIREKQLGPEHPLVAEVMYDFAFFQETQGNTQEALSLYQRTLAICERVLGSHHPKTRETQRGMLSVLRELGRHEEAASFQAILSELIRTEEEQEKCREA